METLHNTNGVVTKKLTYVDGGGTCTHAPSAYAPGRPIHMVIGISTGKGVGNLSRRLLNGDSLRFFA